MASGPDLVAWLLVSLVGVAPVVACTAFEAPDPVQSPNRIVLSRRRCTAGAAGIAGLGLGWVITPMKTDYSGGAGQGVRTAEAWRRKIKSRRPIPLAQRSPRILAVSLLCFSLTEYGLALQTHSPRESLDEVHAIRLAKRYAKECRARWLALNMRTRLSTLRGAKERSSDGSGCALVTMETIAQVNGDVQSSPL